MTNNTIIDINSAIVSLASQIEEVMKTRDQKIEEVSNIIKELEADISKREAELIKKQDKLSALKDKKTVAESELAELKGISNPFEKKVNPAPVVTPVVTPVITPVVTPAKIECKSTASISTSFSGKALPAYDGKNDLRVKHPDGRMCFIKEGEVEVGKEYIFDILNEGNYGTSYKVKAISEVLPVISKEPDTHIEENKEEVKDFVIEESNAVCYSSGEDIKNTPFAKLFANMKK